MGKLKFWQAVYISPTSKHSVQNTIFLAVYWIPNELIIWSMYMCECVCEAAFDPLKEMLGHKEQENETENMQGSF